MANFSYVAYETSGRKRTGMVTASDLDSAVASLAATGAHVLEIKEGGAAAIEAKRKSAHVSRSDLALYTRRLADLATAGLPLDRALQLAGEQSENAALEAVTLEAIRDVRSGLPISEALAKFPRLFPSVFTMTLRAGEASGQFPQVATRLAELQQTEVRRRSQLIGALIYPGILAATAVGVVFFLMGYVVPKLSTVFNALGNDLPVSTKFLLATSEFVSHRGIYILVGLLLVLIAYRAWTSTAQGAYTVDKLLLRLPVVGKVISKSAFSRYSRVLGTLTYGGVPILESLRIAGAAAGNRVLAASSDQVQQEVREGRRIGEAMKETGIFPSLVVQMISVGEETGDLPTMLARVSETLDFEVDTGMQKLTAMLEPIIVLGMGGFVGFVVLSILLPIYQAQDLVK